MAHTDVSKTFVGTPGSGLVAGGIWRVPQNLVLPTNAYDARPGGAIRLGGVSDEGYTYTSERATDKKRDWNGDKVRSLQTSKDDTLEITFIEFLNPDVMALVYGNDNVTVTPATTAHGTHIATKSVADVLEHGAYIIDTKDGKVKRRRCVPDAQPDKIDPIAEKPGDWSVYKVTFDIFPDSQGVTSYTYTELADRLTGTPTPTGWTVTVAKTSGTYSLLVDGQATGPIDVDAYANEVHAALEELPNVGGGNATVSGVSGGPYTISLVNGGLLTTDDAEVTVASS